MSDDSLSLLVQGWRNESPMKALNFKASLIVDQVNPDNMKAELQWYLSALWTDDPTTRIYAKRIEGPEDFGVLLSGVETMKKYQARIRAIGIDAHYYHGVAEESAKIIKRFLSLQPEFSDIRPADARDTVVELVAREVTELKTAMERIEDIATAVGKEYASASTTANLTYNTVNSMSFFRGLYGSHASGQLTAPRRA